MDDFCCEWDHLNSDAREFVVDHLQKIASSVQLQKSQLRLSLGQTTDKTERRKMQEEILTLSFKMEALQAALKKLSASAAVPSDHPK